MTSSAMDVFVGCVYADGDSSLPRIGRQNKMLTAIRLFFLTWRSPWHVDIEQQVMANLFSMLQDARAVP